MANPIQLLQQGWNITMDGLWQALSTIHRYTLAPLGRALGMNGDDRLDFEQIFDMLWGMLVNFSALVVNLWNLLFDSLWFLISSLDLSNVLPVFGGLVEQEPEALASFIAKIILGLILARIARFIVSAAMRRTNNTSPQVAMLVRRGVSYSIFAIFLFSALSTINDDFTWLLGAAGVFSLAIGFAAQTSVSNLISGFFLLGERVANIGDVIEVDGTTGEVIAIDLISTKLRTFDNLLVRIPNETMIKAKIKNLSAFPIRRVDVKVGIAYKESIERAREILFEVAERNPLCLAEPKPLFMIEGYGASSIDILFQTWTTRQNWLDLKNTLHIEIKHALDLAGIEIPFPHLSIYAGEATAPFPLQRAPKAQAHPTAAAPEQPTPTQPDTEAG